MIAKDLVNYRTGKLTVLYRAGSTRDGQSSWMCQCECGNERVYSYSHLTRKKQPVKSCGCAQRNKGAGHAQWTGHGDISGSWWNGRILRELFGKSRRANVLVDLTIEQAWDLFLQQDRKCALTGIPLVIRNTGGTASLDRIDSSIGYTLSNVQWVHKDINFMKRSMSQEYFQYMCTLVAQHVGA